MKNINLSIIIPILNEEKNITKLVKEVHLSLKNKIKFEIIFVDDNSTDNTKQVIKKLAKKFKNIRYFLRKKNRDLSKSCIFGFEKSKSNIIAVMDGDLQHDPKKLLKMFQLQKKNDLDFVIGIRNFKKRSKLGLSHLRYYASIFIIIIFNIFVGKKTLDPMSGFFIFKKIIYDENKKKLFKTGYKILADLIFLPRNFKILDYQINFRPRKSGKSKMSIKILLTIINFIFFNFIRKYR